MYHGAKERIDTGVEKVSKLLHASTFARIFQKFFHPFFFLHFKIHSYFLVVGRAVGLTT